LLKELFVPKISACVITFNDEQNVEWSISSVRWADEIVVVDTGSTDRTLEIARSLGARVEHSEPFKGFGAMRNRAIEYCSHEWVFSLDADEHCTPVLRDEIVALLAGDPAHDAYYILRYNYFMGRWIKGSGWYRDHRTPQLFRKSCFRYSPSLSHESFELSSDRGVGTLKNEILHYPFCNLEEVLTKANLYSSLGAEAAAGKRVSMWSALGHGLWAFLRMYIFKRGFVDGWAGFIIALSNFEGTFYRYAKRYERQRAWGLPTDVSAPPPKA
jgi:glycosyltransferase involved in cell wall biosynthesis